MSGRHIRTGPDHAITDAVKRDIPVIFQDNFILVVDKPSGVLSIPDRYDPDTPVLTSLLAAEFGRLYVVHRIDKDTSGVLVFARDAESHRKLNSAFSTHAVAKSYRAIVRGVPDEDEWSCDFALKPDADRLHRTSVDKTRGKEASTAFKVLERYRDYSLVEAVPEGGRTHQIRVHLAATGWPILADPLYGDGKALLLSSFKRGWKGDPFDEKPLMTRTALHALSVRFAHPETGAPMSFEAPLPKDMRATIAQLSKA